METFVYRPKGVCSREMRFEMEGDVIRGVTIVGGCPGNLTGISRLLQNQQADAVIAALDGVRCGGKPTSCPDQIAQALKAYQANRREE